MCRGSREVVEEVCPVELIDSRNVLSTDYRTVATVLPRSAVHRVFILRRSREWLLRQASSCNVMLVRLLAYIDWIQLLY